MDLILSGSDNGKQVFALLSNGSKGQAVFEELKLKSKNGTWSFIPSSRRSVKIRFIDQNRQIIETPQNGEKLYFGTQNKDGLYNPLRVQDGNLVFEDHSVDDRTVYLEVPPGLNFKYNDIRGKNWIYAGKQTLSSLLDTGLFNVRLSLSPSDLDPNNNQVIVGKCIPDCIGKFSSEDDGCGGVCPDKCSGDCGGKCPGKCPEGYQCSRDTLGNFKCVPNNGLETENILLIIGMVIILILIIMILVIYFRRR
jgi:hypothetical protein